MYQAHPLPRRAFLGLALSARDGAMTVAAVSPEGAAAMAGVLPSDVLVELDGVPIHDATELQRRTRTLRVGASVTFRVIRSGEARLLSATAYELPREPLSNAELELGQVEIGEARLRTLVTVPRSRGPHPAVLFLQGFDCISCESPLDPRHPLRALVDDWAGDGLLAMRVERSGVGDSEGPPATHTDFSAELETHRAGLAALGARPDVDPERLFVFGHSLGGMVAPLIAAGSSLAGVVAFGTSALPWHDCLLATESRRRALAGKDDPGITRFLELHALIGRDGCTPDEARSRRPDLAPLLADDPDLCLGRHFRFVQQLQRARLLDAWRALDVPALVMHGAFDWICSEDEGRAIVQTVNTARPGSASFLELPAIGHDLLAHGDAERCFLHPPDGRWTGEVAKASAAWMLATKAG